MNVKKVPKIKTNIKSLISPYKMYVKGKLSVLGFTLAQREITGRMVGATAVWLFT